jgi:hypothetical protein
VASVDARFTETLNNRDRTSRDYVDTGQDILMFVFSGGLRSPLDQ